MKVVIIKEQEKHETRVAVSPDSVKKLIDLGLDVVIETGAGTNALFFDEDYKAVGAEIVPDPASALSTADILFSVISPTRDQIKHLPHGAILIGMLAPYAHLEEIKYYAKCGVDAFSMELIPRVSRAQSMDVVSSQANLAGYKAVIDAAAMFSRAIPMMMTAAGTIAPARAMVLGVGVAGLQAIATARRLGAITSATDIRPAVKEQVESLGASFIMVESEETKEAETTGGYAKEMSKDYQRRQAELVAETLANQDIAITTALIPGRPAPLLITQTMVERMRHGSIIVDLVVEQGGNCELSQPGKVIEHEGVKILGHFNVPGRLPVDASRLYANNLVNFITLFVNKESGEINIDWNDELIKGTALTRAGTIIHPIFSNINK